MLRGDKSSYTDKQKRQATHIEAGYEKRGLTAKTAESRAWATVNKRTGGGKKMAAAQHRFLLGVETTRHECTAVMVTKPRR